VKSCQPKETIKFRNISHEELCKAVEYWIEETCSELDEPNTNDSESQSLSIS
jgi:hypothetical protein